MILTKERVRSVRTARPVAPRHPERLGVNKGEVGIEHSGVVQHCLSTRWTSWRERGVVLAHYSLQAWGMVPGHAKKKSQHSTVLILLSSRGGQPIPTCNGSRFSCMALCLYRAVTVGRVGGGGFAP